MRGSLLVGVMAAVMVELIIVFWFMTQSYWPRQLLY